MNNYVTKENAIKRMQEKFPKKAIRSCDEYSTGYVIEVVPKGEENSEKVYLDSTWFVSKDGFQISVYMPGMVPKNEIKSKEDLSGFLEGIIKKSSINKGKEYLRHFNFE